MESLGWRPTDKSSRGWVGGVAGGGEGRVEGRVDTFTQKIAGGPRQKLCDAG